MVDRGAGKDWHRHFCTPRCAYDWWRQMLDEDYGVHIEPDLLVVAASDIFYAIDEACSEENEEAAVAGFREVEAAWLRLGHVLGQLDPRPPELVDAERAQLEERRAAFVDSDLARRFKRALEAFTAAEDDD